MIVAVIFEAEGKPTYKVCWWVAAERAMDWFEPCEVRAAE